MAEAIFDALVAREGLSNLFQTESAGTSDSHEGENYHPQTRRVCADHQFPRKGTSRPVREEDFQNFDYILAMDESNYRNLKLMDSQGYAKLKIFYFRSFSSDENRTNMNVPDPYYGDAEDFDILFDLLSDCAEGLLKRIRTDRGI